MLGAFANGLIITILPAFLLGVLGAFGDANTTFGDADFGWFGILIGWSAQLTGALGIILCALIGIAVLALGWWSQRKLVDGNWDPTPWRDVPAGDPNAASDGNASKSVSAGLTAASAKYPKVAPPQGAPTPPAPQY